MNILRGGMIAVNRQDDDESLKRSMPETGETNIIPRGSTLKNAIVRFGVQFVAILINLLATPYIIRELGVESYGIVGVINVMIGYMSIITISLTSTVGRNLTFAVERREHENANKEISTAVYGLLMLFVLAVPFLCALAVYIDRLIIIPTDIVYHTRVFLFLSFISFGFATISGPIGAAMFVRNRLDLFSWASLARTILFVAFLVAAFSLFHASLTLYGTALLASSIVLFILHKQIHRQLLPDVEISKRWFDRTILKGIMSLGGWMTVNQIGTLLFLQTDLIVANRILGPVAAGQMAAISIISLQLRGFANIISGLFAPNQSALAAHENWPEFSAYLFRSIRLTTLFMALLVGVFCGSAHEVLSIWLGEEFGALTPVAIMLTAYLVVTLGVSPSWNALLAVGKVKIPAIVTLVMGGGNVVLGVILSLQMGLMGIALAGCIMLSLRNILFTYWYISLVCGIDVRKFIYELLLGLFVFGLIYLISTATIALFRPDSMVMLGVSLLVAACGGGLIVVPLGFRSLRTQQ